MLIVIPQIAVSGSICILSFTVGGLWQPTQKRWWSRLPSADVLTPRPFSLPQLPQPSAYTISECLWIARGSEPPFLSSNRDRQTRLQSKRRAGVQSSHGARSPECQVEFVQVELRATYREARKC